MGMMHVVLARHLGAARIIGADLFETRARRAVALGADAGLMVSGDNLVEQVREATGGAMADVVIVGPGSSKAIAQGIAAAGKGATVVQFTATPPEDEMTLSPHDLYFNETRLVPSYSCGPDDTREAMALVDVNPVRRRPGDPSLSAGAGDRSLRDGAEARIAQSNRYVSGLGRLHSNANSPGAIAGELTASLLIRTRRPRRL